MLWKGKLLAAVIALTGSAIAFVAVHYLPAVYRAEALILVDSQRIPEKYVSATVNGEVQDRLMTIRQQILSTTRLLKIIDSFGLYKEERKKMVQEEIIEQMQRDVSIKLEKGWTRDRPGAFRVGYEGQNPALVTEVANQLANLFIEENLRAREKEAEGTADFIDSQLQEAKKTLDELEAKVSLYKLQHNGELPQQETSLSSTLNRLQTELQGNQDALNRAQQNRLVLQSNLSMAEASEAALVRALDQPAGTTFGSDGGSNAIRGAAPPALKKSEALQQQYEAMKARLNLNHPDMQALQKQIEVQKQLERQEEAAAAEFAKSLQASAEAAKSGQAPPPSNPIAAQRLQGERERVETLRTQLIVLDREIAARNSDRERVLKSIAGYQGRVEHLPVREQEMSGLTRDYEMAQLNYKSLLAKKVSAGMATDMERRQQSERFTMLDPARVPEKPVSPNRPLLAGLGGVLSLALALGLVILREMKRGAILGEWELPPGVPVLGRVPFIHGGAAQAPGTRRPRKLRWAVVSSAAILLVVSVLGAYVYWGRV